jgi:SAM-dependent methyltransferase
MKRPQPKTLRQIVWDAVGIPARLVLFPPEWLEACGWTTLEEERMRHVLPELRGRLLDIGAGPNTLVKLHGQGAGVDVHDWGGGAIVVDDTASVPFADGSFDTVTFIACLNHIPNREAVLREARRVLAPGGRVVMTMINPLLGGVGHAIWWYSEDKQRGGMLPGEVGGLWTKDIVAMCSAVGLRLAHHHRFVYGMNHLYVFVEEDAR